MKTRILLLLFTGGCLLTLTAWLTQVPNQAHADEVPEKYRDTVKKGLEYLVKHQHKDGHWEGDDGKHPVAMTGLVGVALLMECADDPSEAGLVCVERSKYITNVQRAADWLLERSNAGRDGLIFSEHPSETARYMQGHGLATLFLAGAAQMERDPKRLEKLDDAVTRAVKYIVKAQSSRGGWYHTSRVEGHDLDAFLDTVIQIQALHAARKRGGVSVPKAAIRDGQTYLKQTVDQHETAKVPSARRTAETAAALACRLENFTAEPKINEVIPKWFKYCGDEIPKGAAVKFGQDELTHYYYAQARFSYGEGWTDYRTAMFDRLQDSQNKDGSWPAAEGISVGHVYATALWCTVLQLDRSCHPSSRPLFKNLRD